MPEPMNKWTFKPIDRDTPDLFPASVQEYLLKTIWPALLWMSLNAGSVEIDQVLPWLGLQSLAPGHDGILIVLWICNRCFSSRKLEKATYDSIAFRFICANQHPDHDSIRSDLGRQCRDTFSSLRKTCKKQKLSFWAFLQDRLSLLNAIPLLGDLVIEKSW